MGAVSKPIQQGIQGAFSSVAKVVGAGGDKAQETAQAAPAAQAAQAAKAPLVPATAVQQAREMIGAQTRKRGRAANILAGEQGSTPVGQKRLLGE